MTSGDHPINVKLNLTFLGLSATSSSLLCCAPSDGVGFESDAASSDSDGFVGLRCLSSDSERSFVDSITVGKQFLIKFTVECEKYTKLPLPLALTNCARLSLVDAKQENLDGQVDMTGEVRESGTVQCKC